MTVAQSIFYSIVTFLVFMLVVIVLAMVYNLRLEKYKRRDAIALYDTYEKNKSLSSQNDKNKGGLS